MIDDVDGIPLQINLSIPEGNVCVFILSVKKANHRICLLHVGLGCVVHAPFDPETSFQLTETIVEVDVLNTFPVERRCCIIAEELSIVSTWCAVYIHVIRHELRPFARVCVVVRG